MVGNNKPKINRKGDTTAVSGYDICQTPPHALEPLLPLLDTNWTIWEPMAGPERILARTLRKHGFTVVDTDLLDGDEYNFFTYQPEHWTMLLTNTAFSIKYDMLEHAFSFGRPIAVIVPYETTFAAKFRNVARLYHNKPWPIEVLTPERRINYKMPNTGWGVEEWSDEKQKMVKRGDSAQMPTMWLTWGLNAGAYYNQYLHTYEIPMRNVRYNADNTEKL